jgi:hypothetical protein
VPATVVIGKYQLTFEARGLRIGRPNDEKPMMVSPLLGFSLTEAGSPTVAFQMQRLNAAGAGVAEFHAYTSQRTALYGRVTAVAGDLDGLDVEIRIENATDDLRLRVGAHMVLSGEADPRWLVPGFFYGNNRPPGSTRVYPTYSEINRDLRKLVSNHWAVRSDRAATPLVCAWTYGCFAYIATEGVFGRSRENLDGVGMTGLQFGSEEGQPTLGVEFPYREVPVKFSFCHEDKIEPEETYVILPKTTPMVVRFTLGLGQPDLHAYSPVIRHLYHRFEENNPTPPEGTLESQEHLAHTGLLRWHFDSRQAAIYESASFDRHFGRKGTYTERAHMHAGWLSGALPAYALLWAGREGKHVDSINAGTSVLNKFTAALSPAGTIFPVWTEENGWSCSFGPEDGTAHSRTIAEGVLFLLRAIGLEIKHNANHQQWFEAALSSLNYAMGAQREDGAFPTYYDLTTGRPTSYDGCGGLPWLAAFATGCSLLQKPHFKEVAIKAGEYYSSFIRNGLLYGTVEDLHCVPTSDDCHWALIAYIALYELDRDTKWLGLARKAADLALSWRFTYNVAFSRGSLLGRYGVLTRGGDITSVASPGVGCQGLVSYRELLKLAAYTGDDYYRLRAEDGRRFAQQLVIREDGQFNARAGMVAGLIFHTDWWQPKGMLLTLSNAMAGGLFKYAQLLSRSLNITARTVEDSRAEFGNDLVTEPVFYADIEGPEEQPIAGLVSGAFGVSAVTPTPRGGRSGEVARPPATGPSRPQVQLPGAGAGGLFNLPGIPMPGASGAIPKPGALPEPRRQEPLSPAASRTPPPGLSRQDIPRSPSRPEVAPPPGSGSRQNVQLPGGMTEKLGSILGIGGGSPRNSRASRGFSGEQIPLPSQGKSEPAPYSTFGAHGGAPNPADRPPEPENKGDDEVEIKYKIF